jgi:hypothetical protein
MTRKFSCPGCRSELKVAHTLPATLRCPRCTARFVAEPDGCSRLAEQASDSMGLRLAIVGGGLGALVLLLVVGVGVLALCLQTGQNDSEDDDTPQVGGRSGPPKSKQQPVPLEPVAFVKKAPQKNAAAAGVAAAGKPNEGFAPGQAKGLVTEVEEVVVESAGPAQKDIDEAIRKGVAYLSAGIENNGICKGNRGNLLGTSALVGLTLLSCGEPTTDRKVGALASRVRSEGPVVMATYDIACCIWFLDKLGDQSDTKLIQKLALRLIAGQGVRGGWNYNCAELTSAQEAQLLKLLEEQGLLPTPVVGEATPDQPAPEYVAAQAPGKGTQPGKQPAQPKTNSRGVTLPADFRQLPVMQFQPGQKMPATANWHEDNSLTQFAILALWAAQKHGVPAQRSLAFAEAHFRESQNANGTWGYLTNPNASRTDSMTCAGLLGLAVGRGLDKRAAGDKNPPPDAGKDPMIDKALLYLGSRIGLAKALSPEETAKAEAELRDVLAKIRETQNADEKAALQQRAQELAYKTGRGSGKTIRSNAWGDLYFLWSLERVAVVYDLQTIGGKDWYAWGASALVTAQKQDGSWSDAFAGPVDTCFALLFLKRVNVAQSLTKVLKKVGPVQDPGASSKNTVQQQPLLGASTPGDNKLTPGGQPGAAKLRNGYAAIPPGSRPRSGRRRRSFAPVH